MFVSRLWHSSCKAGHDLCTYLYERFVVSLYLKAWAQYVDITAPLFAYTYAKRFVVTLCVWNLTLGSLAATSWRGSLSVSLSRFPLLCAPVVGAGSSERRSDIFDVDKIPHRSRPHSSLGIQLETFVHAVVHDALGGGMCLPRPLDTGNKQLWNCVLVLHRHLVMPAR